MKKAEMIKLFTAMEDNCWKLAEQTNDPEYAIKMKAEAMGYATVINCMTNSKFANEMAEIFLT